MTEIVDERQRLVAQTLADLRDADTPSIDYKASQALRRAITLIRALASPSEGNKKGEPQPGKDGNYGYAHDPADQSRDDWHRFNDNGDVTYTRKSRPQEQPRKATGEVERRAREVPDILKTVANKLNPDPLDDRSSSGVAATWLYEARCRLVGYFASPAAAQGWQTIETARKLLDETLHWIPDHAAVRYRILRWLAAAPSAPVSEGWQPRETAPKNGTLEWRVLMHWQDMGSSSGWSLLAMTHWRPAAPQEQEK